MNYKVSSLENLRNAKYIDLHKIIFGGTDVAGMKLISKYKKGIQFLLCVIDIHSKYVWVLLLRCKKGIKFTNAFQKVLDKSGRKSNKKGVVQGS